VNEPTVWHGCYSDNWNGVIVAEAFAHPAKFARGLIRRIYEHMRDSGYITPGDRVIDPFGGIGAGAVDAMSMGLHWYGCELEPRFVALGQRNIDKWQRDLAMLNGDACGTARICYRAIAAYSGSRCSVWGWARRLVARRMRRHGSRRRQWQSPTHGNRWRCRPTASRIQDRAYSPGRHKEPPPANLPPCRAGDYGAAVSSPPYADNAATWVEGPGARHDPIHHNGDNAFKASSDNGYGSTPGNVGNMRDGGFEGGE
jgi:hypothetical protein